MPAKGISPAVEACSRLVAVCSNEDEFTRGSRQAPPWIYTTQGPVCEGFEVVAEEGHDACWSEFGIHTSSVCKYVPFGVYGTRLLCQPMMDDFPSALIGPGTDDQGMEAQTDADMMGVEIELAWCGGFERGGSLGYCR